jgi:hypothetical protein
MRASNTSSAYFVDCRELVIQVTRDVGHAGSFEQVASLKPEWKVRSVLTQVLSESLQSVLERDSLLETATMFYHAHTLFISRGYALGQRAPFTQVKGRVTFFLLRLGNERSDETRRKRRF